MKGKVYYVFKCGCRALTATRLTLASGKSVNCCPKHQLNGPVSHKEYQCAECGKIVEISASSAGVKHKFCPKCSYARRLQKARDRAKVHGNNYHRFGGGNRTHSTHNEIELIRTFKPETLKKYYYEAIPLRKNWGNMDPAVIKQECEKLLEVPA